MHHRQAYHLTESREKIELFSRLKEINPKPIDTFDQIKLENVAEFIENCYTAYNARRVLEACEFFSEEMLKDNVTIGLSLAGAMTPAGYGISCLIPMIRNGLVDYIISTGANVYHDLHFGLGQKMYNGIQIDDRFLREQGITRIEGILFDTKNLFETDSFISKVISQPEFQDDFGSAEIHYKIGRYISRVQKELGFMDKSFVAAAYEYDVPIYTSSPGDSSLGMTVSSENFIGNKLKFDVEKDVNETAAIVLNAKQNNGKSAVLIIGGGSPKNFLLQTEPQIQESFFIKEKGHDYFIQITDARPDTGGLSGATATEAVTWGKVDPDKVQDTKVAYIDATAAKPLLVAYALAKGKKREPKRLYKNRDSFIEHLRKKERLSKEKPRFKLNECIEEIIDKVSGEFEQ